MDHLDILKRSYVWSWCCCIVHIFSVLKNPLLWFVFVCLCLVFLILRSLHFCSNYLFIIFFWPVWPYRFLLSKWMFLGHVPIKHLLPDFKVLKYCLDFIKKLIKIWPKFCQIFYQKIWSKVFWSIDQIVKKILTKFLSKKLLINCQIFFA